MADNILQSFLVSIGYRVDTGTERKFNESLTKATLNAQLLAKAIEETARAVVKAVTDMAVGFEDLYYASQRTNTSVQSIKALGYAVGQLGGSYAGAVGSLEQFARQMRDNPGYGAMVRQLGVATSQNGKLRETTSILEDLGKVFRSQRYEVARQYATALGLDENTFRILRDQPDALRKYQEEYNRAVKTIGLNQQDAADNSKNLNQSLRSLWMTVGVVAEKILSDLTPSIKGFVDKLREWIEAHPEKIAEFTNAISTALQQLGTWAIKALEALTPLLTQLADNGSELIKDGSFLDGLNKIIHAIDTMVKWIGTLITWIEKLNNMPFWPSGLAGIKAAMGIYNAADNATPENPVSLTGTLASAARGTWSAIKGAFGGAGKGQPLPKGGAAKNAAAITEELRKSGYNENAIAAVLGSMQTESSFNPGAHNDQSGGHTGLWQWDRNRWPKIAGWIKAQGGDPMDPRWQTRAWIGEHNAKPGDALYDSSQTSQGGAILRGNPSLEDAVHGVRLSERFGPGEEGGRAANARKWVGNLPKAPTAPGSAIAAPNTSAPLPSFARPGGPDFSRAPSLAPGSLAAGANDNSVSNEVTLHQKTEINVMGASDPIATGASIAGHQDRVNSLSVRNAQGAIR